MPLAALFLCLFRIALSFMGAVGSRREAVAQGFAGRLWADGGGLHRPHNVSEKWQRTPSETCANQKLTPNPLKSLVRSTKMNAKSGVGERSWGRKIRLRRPESGLLALKCATGAHDFAPQAVRAFLGKYGDLAAPAHSVDAPVATAHSSRERGAEPRTSRPRFYRSSRSATVGTRPLGVRLLISCGRTTAS